METPKTTPKRPVNPADEADFQALAQDNVTLNRELRKSWEAEFAHRRYIKELEHYNLTPKRVGRRRKAPKRPAVQTPEAKSDKEALEKIFGSSGLMWLFVMIILVLAKGLKHIGKPNDDK